MTFPLANKIFTKPKEDKVNDSTPVLIVARPGRMRDSLGFLLKSMPDIEIVGQADDSSSALRMITEHGPALILLDGSLDRSGTLEGLKSIKSQVPGTPCVVIISRVQERERAYVAGAEGVLLRGFATPELAEIIDRLVQ